MRTNYIVAVFDCLNIPFLILSVGSCFPESFSEGSSLLVGGGRDVGGDVSVVGVGQLQSVAVDSCARRGECKVVSGETCEGRGSSKARPGTRAQAGGMRSPVSR